MLTSAINVLPSIVSSFWLTPRVLFMKTRRESLPPLNSSSQTELSPSKNRLSCMHYVRERTSASPHPPVLSSSLSTPANAKRYLFVTSSVHRVRKILLINHTPAALILRSVSLLTVQLPHPDRRIDRACMLFYKFDLGWEGDMLVFGDFFHLTKDIFHFGYSSLFLMQTFNRKI